MANFPAPNLLRRCCALLLALATAPARAALGGDAASVEGDRRALAAPSLRTTARGAYAVHELTAGALIPLVLWGVWKATQRVHARLQHKP